MTVVILQNDVWRMGVLGKTHWIHPKRTCQVTMLTAFAAVAVVACVQSMARADAVDGIVRDQMAQQGIPGVAVAVLKAGQLVKTAAFGVTGTDEKVPTTPDSVFRLQSATKPFTAVATLMLVEAGKIALDDSVSQYVPACPDPWRKITVRHLLSHTSGLQDFVNAPTIDLTIEATDEQLMKSVANRPLLFEPGTSWDYNSTNYLLLGMIIRDVTGLWYGDFLSQRIFQPLGMTHTRVSRDRATAVKGYALDNGRVVPAAADTTLAMSVLSYAGGGMQSTVLDLAKWDSALHTERLLRRATLEQMWTPVILNNGVTYPYGLGWNVTQIAQHRRVWHTGVWTGFAAIIDRLVDDQLTVIVLTNLSAADTTKMSRAIAATYVPALGVRTYQAIADGEPETKRRLTNVLRNAIEGDKL